jgi:hypothetical protein
MESRLALLALALLSLSGCDSWYWRRMDLAESQVAVTSNADSRQSVLEAVREYAKQEGIPCKDSGKLPIDCWRQPIRLWAFENGNIISVCYSAMGIPLESGKFTRRMDEFEALIRKRVETTLTVTPLQCPNAPAQSNAKDL